MYHMLEVKGKASETFFIKIRALAVLAVGWITLWDLKRIEKKDQRRIKPWD